MTTFSVEITVDAADADAAGDTVASWTLSAGALILSIRGQPEYVDNLPLAIGEDGSVANAIEAAKEAADEPAVAPDQPEPDPPPLPGAG